ncbi:MAG TPA: 1-deoxy-D-xylulose-5-phosphate synthase [Clostridiaceae bacterium]|jgi:1-deoxy-D-xylulose-5-phosphate synthase|nr:1-deoxy-D-xylulose-5-phosphate synthase [Clostridiaceae bacterium]
MEDILNNITNPKDLKKLNYEDKKELAEEIRSYIIDVVSKNGGHLASNLGVVELTIALHSIFDTPKDKIIWDVGHQTYVHKILTGRKNQMKTLRRLDGISGFPKTTESEYDCFNTGHSSTSISAALGMARARDILNENYKVIAVIGDGALTGGMAEEALNDAGASKSNIIVVLNDNEMSISKNVGGISLLLGKMRTKNVYTKANEKVRIRMGNIPKVGNKIVKLTSRIKNSIKQIFISKMYFEDIGYTYLGPVDGNDIEAVEEILEQSKKCKGPVLVHVVTKKGKGYKLAEKNPSKFHGTAPFDKKTGEVLKAKSKDYSKVFGEKLVEIAKNDNRIVAITAAMADGTGLSEFKKKYPKRFFDVGIAEQHAIGMAAGMAKSGLIPVVPIYSSFYQRAYDQVIHDVCMQNLHVIMCADRAGIVGNDGETHQGLLDMASFSIVPNMTIMAPKDFKDLEQMIDFAVNFNGPILIRYPRGGEGKVKFKCNEKIVLGESELLKEGSDVTIIAIGKMVEKAVEVADEFSKIGVNAEIINARFLKPFDENKIIESIEKTKNVITIEDGLIKGGLATTVNELIAKNGIIDVNIKNCGYDDEFVKQGSVQELEQINGLDCNSIVASWVKNENIVNEVLHG